MRGDGAIRGSEIGFHGLRYIRENKHEKAKKKLRAKSAAWVLRVMIIAIQTTGFAAPMMKAFGTMKQQA